MRNQISRPYRYIKGHMDLARLIKNCELHKPTQSIVEYGWMKVKVVVRDVTGCTFSCYVRPRGTYLSIPDSSPSFSPCFDFSHANQPTNQPLPGSGLSTIMECIVHSRISSDDTGFSGEITRFLPPT